MISRDAFEALLEVVPMNDLAPNLPSTRRRIVNELQASEIDTHLLAAVWYVLLTESIEDPEKKEKYAKRAIIQLDQFVKAVSE